MEFNQLRAASMIPGKPAKKASKKEKPPPDQYRLSKSMSDDLKSVMSALVLARKENSTITLTPELVTRWGTLLSKLVRNNNALNEELELMEAFGESCFAALENSLYNKDEKVRAEVESWYQFVKALKNEEGESK